MLMMAIILLVCAAILELVLAYRIPWLGKLLERFPVAAVLFSIVLSLFMGLAFGAAGLIVFVAAVGSTVITVIVYRLKVLNFLHRIFDNKVPA
jgi:hypothetical protein